MCLVFEKVNTGGVSLTVWELITASFAAEGFNLRDDWFGSNLRKIEGRAQRLKKEALLEPIENTDFVQAITGDLFRVLVGRLGHGSKLPKRAA